MTTQTIDFIFDFASPNAYLAYKVLPKVASRTGARINVIPCLLGGIFKATGNQPPFAAFANVKSKLAYETLELHRFVAKHGLTAFRHNPHFPVATLLLTRGMVAAQRAGVADRFLDAGLRAMWEDGQKMDDPDVFVRVFDASGLDGKSLLAATQDPEVKAQLIANTDAAVARGAFGIPTFLIGEEMFFGKDRLDQVEEQLKLQARR
jgi:2-hydroxychromene-2-carboxylate isomerase